MPKYTKSRKLLIIGLGNPGEQYQNTPHNAGFLTVDALLARYDANLNENKKLHSEVAETKLGKTKLILAKPQTFMNNSGTAVKALVASYKIQPPKMLFLIHDDIDLELGKIKIVKNRGSGGHKGVEDIIKKLKTKDFYRFRVGIRPKRVPIKRPKAIMNKFVSSQLTKSEQTLFKKAIKRASESLQLAIDEGAEKATNIFNQK